MPQRARDEIAARFLEELSATLDIRSTIDKLNLTEEDARAILKSLIAPRKAVQGSLFATAAEKKKAPSRGVYELRVDGASRGNPGEAGAGAVITGPHGEVVKRLKKYLGVATNNIAEYSALLLALEAARTLDIKDIRVYADSELMVKQINGVYRVKSAELRPLYDRAKALLEGFRTHKVTHVYREDNAVADALANEAIESKRR